jgi:tetratricopeptide (TPR) repeat protein
MTYLRLLLWPSGQSGDWDFRVSRGAWDPAVLVAGLCLAALAAGAVALVVSAPRWREEHAGAARVAGFGVLWFFLVLSPTSSLVPLSDPLVEHRVYLASWGIFAAACAGLLRVLEDVPPRWVPAAAGAAAVLGWVAPAAALHRRNAVWESPRAFWEDVVAKGPGKARGYVNLASVALAEGRPEEAERLLGMALGLAHPLDPVRVAALFALGATHLVLGRTDEAVATLRQALDRDPSSADGLVNLATALATRRELEEAERVAARAVAVAPGRGAAWNALGRVKLARGRAEEALPLFERAAVLDPGVPSPRFNRGAALAALGRREEACAAWAAIDPGRDPRLQASLARARAQHGCVGTAAAPTR